MKGFVDIWIDALYPYTFKIEEDPQNNSSQPSYNNILIVPENGLELRIKDFRDNRLSPLAEIDLGADGRMAYKHAGRIWEDEKLRGSEVLLNISRRLGTLSGLLRDEKVPNYSFEGYGHIVFHTNISKINGLVDNFIDSINSLVGTHCNRSSVNILTYFVSPDHRGD